MNISAATEACPCHSTPSETENGSPSATASRQMGRASSRLAGRRNSPARSLKIGLIGALSVLAAASYGAAAEPQSVASPLDSHEAPTMEVSLQPFYWNGTANNPAGPLWRGGPGVWNTTSVSWMTSRDGGAAVPWPAHGAVAVFGGNYYSQMRIDGTIVVSGITIERPTLGGAPGSSSSEGTSFTMNTPGGGRIELPSKMGTPFNVMITSRDQNAVRIPFFAVDIADQPFNRPSNGPATLSISGPVNFVGQKSYVGRTTINAFATLWLTPDDQLGILPTLIGGVKVEPNGTLYVTFDDSKGDFSFPYTFQTRVFGDAADGTSAPTVNMGCTSRNVDMEEVLPAGRLSEFYGSLKIKACNLVLNGDTVSASIRFVANQQGSVDEEGPTLSGTGTFGTATSSHDLYHATISPGVPTSSIDPAAVPAVPGYLIFNGNAGVDKDTLLVFDVGTTGPGNGLPGNDPLMTANNDVIVFNDDLDVIEDKLQLTIYGDQVGDYTLIKAGSISTVNFVDNPFSVHGNNDDMDYTVTTSQTGGYTYAKLNISPKT
ncbi:hypothetical protein [Martelella sp. FOR1707]